MFDRFIFMGLLYWNYYILVFENKKATDKNFTKTFSNNIDFNATDNFQAREAELSGKVVDMLVQDIFNAAFINW